MKYLIALIAFILPAYLVRFSIGGIPTTLLEITIYVFFLIGLGNVGYSQWGRARCKFWLPVGLILLAAVLSAIFSPLRSTAFGQLKAFFIDPLLVLWLVLTYLDFKDFQWIFRPLVFSSAYVSLHAIVQKIIGNTTVDGRVVGIFDYSPNYIALFLVPVTLLATAYGIEALKGRRKLLAIGYASLVLINLIAIWFSGSRGGLLALAGGIFFYLILRFWNFIKSVLWIKIGIGGLIVLSIVAAGWVYRPNFSLDPNKGGRTVSSNNIRWQIWQTSFELIKKNPIKGVGLGNYQNAFGALTKDRANFPEYITPMALSPHNLYLAFWLTTGLLGLVAFIWLIVVFFRLGFASFSRVESVFLMSAMSVILFHGFVDTPYFKNDLSLMFWLIFGGMVLLNRDIKQKH